MTDRKLMSIMELANDILLKNNKSMTFADIYDAICEIKNISDEEKASMISQVYADFISSAKFIYVGDDEWDIKGRQAIELWDKDGAYYDEYPDFEEELSQFEDSDEDFDFDEDYEDEDEEDEDEEDNAYEHDFDIDDEDEEDLDEELDEDLDDEFMEEFKEDLDDEDAMYDDFESEEDEDYIEDEEDLVFEEESSEDFDDEEYNEYMDDYEKMYDD